jgi:predicted RNase H-like nuclease
VAGVDGCRAGWVVVLRDRRGQECLARVVPDFRAVMALSEKPAVIAVDVPIGLLGVPIGLLGVAIAGGRACDGLARRLLLGRASSVFSPPTRPALDAFRAGGSYREVSVANRGGLPGAPGLSKQTFNILPKIDEVDAALSPAAQRIVREAHPELAFVEANGGRPLRHAKKTAAGQAERARLLRKLGFSAPLSLPGAPRPKGAATDDLLDACIACWTAERIAAGTALVVPDAPPKDARGLRMEIWR